MILKSICLTAGLLLLFACEKYDKIVEPEVKQELLFKSNIPTYPKEKVYVWGDEITAEGVKPHFNAWVIFADASTGFTSETKKYFPLEDKGFNVYAIHGIFSSFNIIPETSLFPNSAVTHHVKELQI